MAQSTKLLLFTSFKELLETESVSKITITDITDRVGVNRHTFYYHFKDINSLVTWGFENSINGFVKEKNTGDLGWESVLEKIVDAAAKSKHFILTLYHSELKDHLVRLLRDCSERIVRAIILDGCSDVLVREMDSSFVVAFVANGLTGVAVDWFEGGMMEEPSVLSQQMVKLCSGSFREVLMKFSVSG